MVDESLKIKASALSLFLLIVLVVCIGVPVALAPTPPPPPPPLNSGWASKPPTIDGAFFPDDEWTNPQLEIMSPIHTFVYIINDGSYLYICVDAGTVAGDYTDDTGNALDGDYCVLAFDVGNDGLWTEDVDTVFVLGYFSGIKDLEHDLAAMSGSPGSLKLHCYASEGEHPGLAGGMGFGSSPTTPIDHRIYEFKIPLNLIGASPGSTVGFSSPEEWDSLPHDYNGGISPRHNIWPIGAVWNDLEGWGDIALASRRAVGGILIPVAKVKILAPWMAVALAAVALTILATKKRR